MNQNVIITQATCIITIWACAPLILTTLSPGCSVSRLHDNIPLPCPLLSVSMAPGGGGLLLLSTSRLPGSLQPAAWNYRRVIETKRIFSCELFDSIKCQTMPSLLMNLDSFSCCFLMEKKVLDHWSQKSEDGKNFFFKLLMKWNCYNVLQQEQYWSTQRAVSDHTDPIRLNANHP